MLQCACLVPCLVTRLVDYLNSSYVANLTTQNGTDTKQLTWKVERRVSLKFCLKFKVTMKSLSLATCIRNEMPPQPPIQLGPLLATNMLSLYDN